MNRLHLHEEVRDALSAGRPVVALESTIIAHGMPHPRNLETARALEDDVRAAGAVPAVIAVADGRLQIGCDAPLLERLATEPGVAKVSRRDLGTALASNGLGATTVSGTLIGARLAGIRVFATGGIGGVHRGVELTGDISADLQELAVSPVAVVSAGAKSILDLPRTLEALETLGVPVIGWRTDEFPAFFTPSSGLRLVHRSDELDDLATRLAAQWELGLDTGALVANPIPAEAAAAAAPVEAATQAALQAAEAAGIAGRDLTPFLLAEIVKRTDGASLDANVALARNNARLAGGLAVALAARG
jgi:pseudouridine-5'-phosphate glycosidase